MSTKLQHILVLASLSMTGLDLETREGAFTIVGHTSPEAAAFSCCMQVSTTGYQNHFTIPKYITTEPKAHREQYRPPQPMTEAHSLAQLRQ
jgi:hypothetical protein